MRRTHGEYEDAFTKAIIKFENEYLGRVPLEVRSYILDDMVLVRLLGIVTPGEAKLAETREGQALVKETRRQLLETSRPLFEKIVYEVLGCHVLSMYTDMSIETGERVIILVIDVNVRDWPEFGHADQRH
jgi:uncharacterized protein YbcI